MACEFPVAVKAKLMLTVIHYLLTYLLIYSFFGLDTLYHGPSLANWAYYVATSTFGTNSLRQAYRPLQQIT